MSSNVNATRRRARVAALVVGVMLGAPATAGAQTYCVNDPACSGVAQPTIEAAVAQANIAADADVIQIGAKATPYVLSAMQTIPPGRPVTIRGAGASATNVTSPQQQTAFTLGDDAAVLELMTVRGLAEQPAVVLSRGLIRNATLYGLAGSAPAAQIKGGIVEDVHAESRTGAAIMVVTETTKTSILRRVTAVAPKGNLSVSVGASSVGDTRILNSRLTGTVSLTWSVNTDSVVPVRLADSLIRIPAGATGVQVVDTGATEPRTAELRNLTIIGPSEYSPLTRGLGVYAYGTGTQNATLDARGVVLTGVYAWTLLASGAAPDTAQLVIADSNIDRTPMRVRETSATMSVVDAGGNIFADPLFVNAAAGDFRPRAGSPLVDAGPASVEAWRAGTDLNGAARLVGTRSDMGAFEFTPGAPSVTVAAPEPAVAAPGAIITVRATGSDPDGDDALAYAWLLPDGSRPSGATASFTAPDAPGTYSFTVVVTDGEGHAASASGSVVVPVERVKPTLQLAGAAITRAKLLARTPIALTVTTNERASATVQLTATVTTPARKRGAKPVRVVVPAGAALVPIAAGARPAQLVVSPAAAKRIAKLLKVRGATAVWKLTGTATDTSRNVGTAKAAALKVR